jgi:uncharacterized membrane protein YqjE
MANRSEIIIERTEQRSIAQIVQDTMRDVQDLVRSEIRLAKAEMEEKTRKAAKAGMLLGAGITVGFLALCCAVVACIAALAVVIPVWGAAIVMFVLLGITAGGAAAAGRSRLRNIDPKPQQTVQSIKEDFDWARRRTK